MPIRLRQVLPALFALAAAVTICSCGDKETKQTRSEVLAAPIAPSGGTDGGPSESESKPEGPLADIIRAFERRKYARVVALWDLWSEELGDKQGEARLLVGQAHLHLRHPEQAIRVLAPLADDSSSPGYLRGQACFYQGAALYEKAQVFASEDPNPADVGRLIRSAEAKFRKASGLIGRDPVWTPRILLARASCFADLNKHEQAEQLWREMLDSYEGNPGSAQAMYELANADVRAGRLKEAGEKLSKLKDRYPSSPFAGRAIERLSEIALVGLRAIPLDTEEWFGAGPLRLSDLQGRVVLLVFWNTWCPHCREELPKIETLHKKYKARGLQVIGVTNNSRGQTSASVQSFIGQAGLTFPNAVDRTGSTYRSYAVSGIPAAAIIDREGRIVWRDQGQKITPALIKAHL